jgi:hypothetical protein
VIGMNVTDENVGKLFQRVAQRLQALRRQVPEIQHQADITRFDQDVGLPEPPGESISGAYERCSHEKIRRANYAGPVGSSSDSARKEK